MALRLYIFCLFVTLIVSASLLFLLIFGVDPFQAPTWIMILFYFSLLLFLTSGLSLGGFYLKIWASNREVIFSHLLPTLRQSLFISFALVGILFLKQLKVLNWWNSLMLLAAIGLIELFFRARKV